MPMPLDAWQDKMQRHFADLAALRAESRLPIFSFEHGIAAEDLKSVSMQLRSRLSGGLPLEPHWLLWVIYATEYGYRFDGHEFWETFQVETPKWNWIGEGRKTLKRWFEKFHREFRGVVPSGPWAKHFSNISWPVTHAILPRYLQIQFAQSLWENRYQLARLNKLDACSVGSLLARQSWNASSRFSKFLEQEELAGRIAMAVLSSTDKHNSPIYEPSLHRIVGDLETVRRAGIWLKEARSTVRDRFEGIQRISSHSSPSSSVAEADRFAAPFVAKHNLVLRRGGLSKWTALIRLPDLTAIAALNAKLATFLKTTRCKVTDGSSAWMPSGWLMSGPQVRVISKWPAEETPVLSFERHDAILENMIDQECRPTKGPLWLFKIGADGLAREIESKIVHPGKRYVAVVDAEIASKLEGTLFMRCTLNCDNTNALEFSVPENPDQEVTDQLHSVSLQVARTLRVWPAGLCAQGWDGEGYTEWLTGDVPCFAIVADHAVQSFEVQIDNERATAIPASPAGKPTFIQLEAVHPGVHMLSIRASRTAAQVAPTVLDGRVTINVRDPKQWVAGTTAHSGLAVFLDPPTPTLDDLTAGEVGLAIQGPFGCSITCSATLFTADGAEIGTYELCKAELPLSASAWIHKSSDGIRREPFAAKSLEAASARLTINADEMGLYVQRLEREHKSIAWAYRLGAKGADLRLHDDSSSDVAPGLLFYPFETPFSPQVLSYEQTLAGIKAQGAGGLYVAAKGDVSDAVVVSTQISGSSLQSLLPQISELHRPFEVSKLFSVMKFWTGCRIVGPLAKVRRENVTGWFANLVVGEFCSQTWLAAERSYRDGGRTPNGLAQVRSHIGRAQSLAAILDRDFNNMTTGMSAGLKWFADAASRYDVCKERPLCEAALRIVSEPTSLVDRYGAQLDDTLAALKQNAALVRNARFLFLRCSAGSDVEAGTRWAW